MSEDTKLQQLIINTLTQEQFEGIVDPSTEEIYLVEDDAEYATVEELAAKQDKLTSDNAGANITITEEEGVVKISATGVVDQHNTTNNIKFWTGTQAEYDNISAKDANTLYIIKE